MGITRFVDVGTSLAASSASMWRGTASFSPARVQPPLILRLYDFEACPFCRLLREALSEMDLDVAVRPCPKGGRRFRPEAERLGGKAQFPYLIDPNTDTAMYESVEIIDYLAQTYDAPARNHNVAVQSLRTVGSQLASTVRMLRGMKARPSRAPGQPLELYSFESSPYSRLVREVLCELEIPYVLRNMAKAVWPDMGPPWVRERYFSDTPITGRNRKNLIERTGRMQVPYLIDPNTGEEMFESDRIITYLETTYAL